MSHYYYVAFVPLLPLATFVLLGLFGRNYFKKSSGVFGVVAILISTLLSLYTAYQYFFIDGKVNGSFQKIIAFKYTWLQFSPNVSIDMGVLLDPISVMMIVIVSFISLMVHIFSLGYMKGEERISQLIFPSFRCLLFPCWVWYFHPISFRSICSGNWWGFHLSY